MFMNTGVNIIINVIDVLLIVLINYYIRSDVSHHLLKCCIFTRTEKKESPRQLDG